MRREQLRLLLLRKFLLPCRTLLLSQQLQHHQSTQPSAHSHSLCLSQEVEKNTLLICSSWISGLLFICCIFLLPEMPKAKPVASASPASVSSPSLLSSALGPLPVSSAPSASPPFEFASQLQQLQTKFNISGDDLKRAQQLLINYRGDLAPVAARLTELGLAKTVPPLAVLNSEAPSSLPPPLVPEGKKNKNTRSKCVLPVWYKSLQCRTHLWVSRFPLLRRSNEHLFCE